jgi:hypothetical protein
MAYELPTAMLTISRLDGSKRTWRVTLSPRTPFEPKALRAALVARFVDDPGTEPEDFTLTISGTAGAPVFLLEEGGELFPHAEEVT